MNILLTRGIVDNNKLFKNIDTAVFTASMWEQRVCYGHAMLTHVCPGETWPMGNSARSMPVELSHVSVIARHRRQGWADLLVRKCLEYAKRKNWAVVLRAAPYGHNGPDKEALVRWYQKVGFRVYTRTDTDFYMVADYCR